MVSLPGCVAPPSSYHQSTQASFDTAFILRHCTLTEPPARYHWPRSLFASSPPASPASRLLPRSGLALSTAPPSPGTPLFPGYARRQAAVLQNRALFSKIVRQTLAGEWREEEGRAAA